MKCWLNSSLHDELAAVRSWVLDNFQTSCCVIGHSFGMKLVNQFQFPNAGICLLLGGFRASFFSFCFNVIYTVIPTGSSDSSEDIFIPSFLYFHTFHYMSVHHIYIFTQYKCRRSNYSTLSMKNTNAYHVRTVFWALNYPLNHSSNPQHRSTPFVPELFMFYALISFCTTLGVFLQLR